MVQKSTDTSDREIVISRIINAPQALVFDVWTDPKHIGEWWGPNGFTITTHRINIAPKGVWQFIMHGPDGTDYPSRIIFTEIVRPERLAYDHDSGEENDPGKFSSVITFENMGDKTKLTMRAIFASAEVVKMVVEKHNVLEGGNQTLSRFEEQLAKKYSQPDEENEFVISREFNAPRELVFKAFTEADRLAQWWGPKGFTMEHVDLDLRPGGRFHYCMKAGNGMEMWGLFVYHEITKPERIVFINSFSDKDGNIVRSPFHAVWPLEVMNILRFSEHDGKTMLTLSGGPYNATAEETKAFIENRGGMHKGFSGTFEQLDEYLDKFTATPIIIERLLNAPIEKVWAAISDKNEMKKWYFDLAEFKAEVGFEFQFTGGPEDRSYLHLCRVTEVVAGKKLAYSWRYDGYEGNSFVSFELFPDGQKTLIKLTHIGLDTFPASNADFAKNNFVQGWTHIIGTSLPAYFETK